MVTQYAEVHGATLINFPYSAVLMSAQNNNTNYGSNPDFVSIYPTTDWAKATGNTLAPVTIAAQPAYNPVTQVCAPNDAPTLISGVWTLGWTVRAASQEQQAAAVLAAMPLTVQINSTSTPSVNGAYTTNPAQIEMFAAQEISILATGNFTNGQTTLLWLDNGVVFPNTAIFVAVAKAYAVYVTECELAIAAGAALPAPTVTIA